MTIAAEHDAPQPHAGAGFVDAVTVAFSDPDRRTSGLMRIGISEDGASGLAILFDGEQTVTARARGGQPLVDSSAERWDDIAVAGVRHAVVQPLTAWTASFDDGDGNGFDLRLTATSSPVASPADTELARVGGMVAYEQLCAVEGVVRISGTTRTICCAGQRGHAWGVPDWDRIELVRTVSAWLEDRSGVLISAVRPLGATPEVEAISGALVLDGVPTTVPRVHLTTSVDGEGRQRRAGIELWTDPERWPHRAAGELACGSSLDLGRLRYDCAFFDWRMEGRTGMGRYDVLRRAT